ncbi:MAG: DUF859 domain-containing protein [Eubacterium sp.]|nr:DUF859 domain-containing protein [Eubacterium sp.]
MAESGILKKSYENDKYILEIEYEVTKTDSNNYFKEVTWGAFFTNNSEEDIIAKSDTISCKHFGVNYYDSINSSMSRTFPAGMRTAIERNGLTHTTKYTDKVYFDVYGRAAPSIDYIISIGRKVDGTFYDSFRLNEAIFLEPFDKIITAVLSRSDAEIGGSIHITTTNKPKCSCALSLKLNGLTESIPLGDTVGETKTVTRWKIPESFASVINPTSKIGVATLECRTYDTETNILIGSKSYLVTLRMPESDKPSIQTKISAVSDVTGADLKNVYLAGFVHFEITNTVTPKNDATVQSINTIFYGQTYPGETSFFEADNHAINTVITNTIPKTAGGSIPVTVKTADSRGLTNETRSYVEITPYQIPKISSFAVHRCLKNGTLDDEGDCCLVEYTFAIDGLMDNGAYRNWITNASVGVYESGVRNVLNATPIKEYPISCNGKQTFSGKTIIPELNTEECFTIMWLLRDRVTFVYETMPLSTAFTLMDFLKDGTGMAFGKVAEKPYLIEFNIPVQFNKNFMPTAEWVNENTVNTINAYLGYDGEKDILGLQVDYENKRFTRLAGAVGLNAGADFDKFNMFGGRKRCNVKPDGTITAFYGDADYSDADVNVQAMVYQPAFYYKVVPIKMDKNTDGLGYHIRKANYYVSDVPKAGFKLHPAFYDENGNAVEYILFSAYEGVYFKDYLPNSSKARYITDALNTDTETNLEKDCILSYGDGKPISGLYKNITLSNAEKLCSNFGKGWHCETIKTLSANQMLMMIEFGMMNMQNAINKGIVNIEEVANANCAGNTGSTRNRGNATGTTAGTAFRFNSEIEPVTYTEDGKKSITYRGIENPWGNIWKMINGINVWGNGEMAGGEPYIADDFHFVTLKHSDNYKAVGFTVANGNGYINAMGYGKEEYDWLFIASQIGGNSALPVGDYFNAVSDLNGAKAATFGGRWTHNTMAGPFLFNFTDTGNSRTRNFGCRTVYIPTAVG